LTAWLCCHHQTASEASERTISALWKTVRERNESQPTDLDVRSDGVGEEAKLGLVRGGVDVEALAVEVGRRLAAGKARAEAAVHRAAANDQQQRTAPTHLMSSVICVKDRRPRFCSATRDVSIAMLRDMAWKLPPWWICSFLASMSGLSVVELRDEPSGLSGART